MYLLLQDLIDVQRQFNLHPVGETEVIVKTEDFNPQKSSVAFQIETTNKELARWTDSKSHNTNVLTDKELYK